MRWDDWEIIKGDGALGTCVLGADLKSVKEEVAVTYIKELLSNTACWCFATKP